jgi:hypothetical protein
VPAVVALTTPPTCTTTAVDDSPVSGATYPITCDKATSDKYDILYVPGTLTVTAQGPALGIVKTATQDHFAAVGDKIDYKYVLTNTGNVTLSSPFTVTDDKVAVTCPATPTTLAQGESITCTATYTVVQADVDAGEVVNTATGHAVLNEKPIDSTGTSVRVPLESVGGETATPGHSATPPATSSQSDAPLGGSAPIFGFLICLAFGALGLLAVTGQRRSVRRS